MARFSDSDTDAGFLQSEKSDILMVMLPLGHFRYESTR